MTPVVYDPAIRVVDEFDPARGTNCSGTMTASSR
jgi:hypothetical protein